VSSLPARFRNLRSPTRWLPWAKRSSAFRREGSPTGASPWMEWSLARHRSHSVNSRAFPAQPDHSSGVRRGLVLYSRMDRRASLAHPGRVGTLPQARYVVYRSIQPDWWESIDMADAMHPQTLVAHGMNGGELPVAFGGPLRLRVPRQLGYKSVKYITRLTITDSLKRFGKGSGLSVSRRWIRVVRRHLHRGLSAWRP
jgi:hypothetical protein